MALYNEVSYSVATYSDSAKNNINSRALLAGGTLNILTVESSGTVSLAASVTDQAVAMGSVASGKLISITSDSAVYVKVNGSGNAAIHLAPQTNTQTGLAIPAFMIMLADAVTSLHLTNPAAVAITVNVSVAGT